MDRIQAIESFSQDHAYRISTPQIANHLAHPSIYVNCLMYQEVYRKKIQTESIEIIRMWPTSQKNNQQREVRKNWVDIQLVKHAPMLRRNQRNLQKSLD